MSMIKHYFIHTYCLTSRCAQPLLLKIAVVIQKRFWNSERLVHKKISNTPSIHKAGLLGCLLLTSSLSNVFGKNGANNFSAFSRIRRRCEKIWRCSLKIEAVGQDFFQDNIGKEVKMVNLLVKYSIALLFIFNFFGVEACGVDCDLPDMPIQMKYLKKICSGRKIYEGRANSEKYNEFVPGRNVRWISVEEYEPRQQVTTRIIERQDFPSFELMLRTNGYKNYLPETSSLEEATNIYHSFPGYQSRAKSNGVISLKIEVIDSGMVIDRVEEKA